MDEREAQARVDRIRAFREELANLRAESVIAFSDSDLTKVAAYHDGLLAAFAHDFYVDLTATEHDLSWGMRITSTLGAIAFSFAVFLFFDHYWDRFSTVLQITLVTAAPVLGLALTEFLAHRYRTPYYTSLASLVAIVCFVMNLYIIGSIFNITSSPNVFLVWGLFAGFLAYRHHLPILLGLALFSFIEFAAATLTILFGYAWPHAWILEFYVFAGLICLALPVLFDNSEIGRYKTVFWFISLFTVYSALEWLLAWPEGSIVPLPLSQVKVLFTGLAFAGGGAGVWLCIRGQWNVGTYLSAIYLVVFMLHKYFEWFWDEWVNYVFFLVLGFIAVGTIMFLRHLRGLLKEA